MLELELISYTSKRSPSAQTDLMKSKIFSLFQKIFQDTEEIIFVTSNVQRQM